MAYLCAIIEVFIYIIIRIISSTQDAPIYIISDKNIILTLSIFNAVCCFIVMIYSVFISDVSSKAIDKLNENLQEIADNDQLTGLRTRHYLFDRNVRKYGLFYLRQFRYPCLSRKWKPDRYSACNRV